MSYLMNANTGATHKKSINSDFICVKSIQKIKNNILISLLDLQITRSITSDQDNAYLLDDAFDRLSIFYSYFQKSIASKNLAINLMSIYSSIKNDISNACSEYLVACPNVSLKLLIILSRIITINRGE